MDPQLSDEEWSVVAGLVRLAIHADRTLSGAEREALAALQHLAGAERWNRAVREARRRLSTREALRQEVRRLRVEPRPMVCRALTALGTEAELLEWVAADSG